MPTNAVICWTLRSVKWRATSKPSCGTGYWSTTVNCSKTRLCEDADAIRCSPIRTMWTFSTPWPLPRPAMPLLNAFCGSTASNRYVRLSMTARCIICSDRWALAALPRPAPTMNTQSDGATWHWCAWCLRNRPSATVHRPTPGSTGTTTR